MAVNISAALITVSDRCARGEQEDVSGHVLALLLREMGADVMVMDVSPDDPQTLRDKLCLHADRADINLVVTTGGTGVAPRDNTPEVTRSVIEREVPGMAEAMRAETLKETPMAMISRGVCGIRSGALIINLPGAPSGVRGCFAVIKPVLAHALSLLAGEPHSQAS